MLSVEVSACGYDKDEFHDFAYSGLYNHIRNSLDAQLQYLNSPESAQMLHAISSQYALIDILKDGKVLMDPDVQKLLLRNRSGKSGQASERRQAEPRSDSGDAKDKQGNGENSAEKRRETMIKLKRAQKLPP